MKNSIDANPFRSWGSLCPEFSSSTGMKIGARPLICPTKWRLRINMRVLMTGMALSLSGCMGVYEGGFECPPGEGVGCKSISEVNEMVNQGLGTRKQEPSTQSSEEETKETVCRKGSSCPSTLDSSEIWYAPRAPWNESLRNESLRDKSRGVESLGDKSPRNKALLEV
jgi:hypothetical protein